MNTNINEKKTWVAAIVLGVIGILAGAFVPIVGIILAIIGIVTAVLHKETHKITVGIVFDVLALLVSGASWAIAAYILAHPELIEAAMNANG